MLHFGRFLEAIQLRPNIAKDTLPLLLCRNVFLLCVAARPNLIALDTPTRQVAKRTILILLTSRPKRSQESLNGILGHPSHPYRGPNRIAFYKAPNDLGTAAFVQPVHKGNYGPVQFNCQALIKIFSCFL